VQAVKVEEVNAEAAVRSERNAETREEKSFQISKFRVEQRRSG